MQVYRTCLAKYADSLFASGRGNRWNSEGNFVIYAAANQSLACLENVVHRSGEGLNGTFAVMVIEIPEDVRIEEIPVADLPNEWYRRKMYPYCRRLGDAWYERGNTAVLRVASAVVPGEWVYLLNARHPDMLSGKIRLLHTQPFRFDPRIKSPDPEREDDS
ncbi:MAG: RES family NAD+ phosphorylase [Cytophagales bacterium]|nr:RES family NAD+ phosphorylase [Cytophagales bacterium]